MCLLSKYTRALSSLSRSDLYRRLSSPGPQFSIVTERCSHHNGRDGTESGLQGWKQPRELRLPTLARAPYELEFERCLTALRRSCHAQRRAEIRRFAGRRQIRRVLNRRQPGRPGCHGPTGCRDTRRFGLGGRAAGTYTGASTARFAADLTHVESTASADLTVVRATPVIAWATPPEVIDGTVLSSAQLNPTATSLEHSRIRRRSVPSSRRERPH